ncbi:cysteine hydrolase family protein [Pedobacter sp. V48]|uniref:cysteine hydrolase family protein n=1 Tax=Pedobacter sp. V48 TaxID=509635 RepID=UPI0003E5893E|nr:cysteine hydrolase family protein [Pedobacter sp. V48]ETZ24077.1 hypothetical protein N824_16190 [Pedobacter sp. V48]
MTKKEALLIIDIQNDYFPAGAYPLTNPETAAKNAKLLIEKFRSDGKNIIHIQHISTQVDAGFLLPGTEGANIHEEVAPIPSEKIIIKHSPNSFHETDLLDHLEKEQITDLVVCGMMTQICVDSSVRAAKDYAFNVTLISDACATLDLEFQGQKISAEHVQLSFISALQFFYADVTTTNQFLRQSI